MFKNAIITGSVAFDDIMDFPGVFSDHILPHKIHQINVSFIVDKLEKQYGGTAANIAFNIHLLAPGRALMLACVGRDGQGYLDWMDAQGISTEGISVEKDLYTASGKVITDKNNNQIWGFYYGALERSNKLKLEKYATKESLVIISANHYTGFSHFQNSAIKLKIPYLYDPGMILTTISDSDLKIGVEHCRYLVGNDYEIAAIQKRINLDSNDIIKLGVTLITTLGEKGVHYQDDGNDLTIPAYSTTNLVDPTGAGDAWRGGFVAGILEDKPLFESLLQANALASFAVEKYGTVNHRPSAQSIKKRMASIKNSM